MIFMLRTLTFVIAVLGASVAFADPALKALIVDGQNNHNWKETTPRLKKALEESGLFLVEVATAPSGDTVGFKPNFAEYNVVVSNYNGAPWPKETQEAFVEYVKNGGGFVSVHAANNSFPEWKEYNEMIGLGGWNGRDEESGPYVRFRDGKIVRDTQAGSTGSHGAYHPFVVEMRNSDHPIAVGLPPRWMHAADELYDRMRGPAENLTVLATAFADPAKGGSGEHEPMLMTIDYGKGRVFHTTLGHDQKSMNCVGFVVTVQRGAEWAATGKVTQKLPDNFPGADKVSVRE
jgi:type 1 glutamine amidotransferase